MSISLVELSVRNRAAPITELLLSKDKPLSPSPFPGSNKTALQYALDQGDLQTAELLLRYGADPNGSLSGNGKDLRTPLQIAVQKQRLDIIELLLRNGANLNKKPHVSMPTPLQMAAELGVVDILTNLLRHGANVDDKLEPSWLRYDDSEPTNVVFLSPLQIAVCSNHTRIIKTLLEFGADANGRSMTTDLTNPKILLLEARHTPLQLAVNKGYWETVRMLLNHNADVNASAHPLGGATALQYAARRGFVQAAQFLLLKGANIDAPPAIKDGRTALEGAAENGELEMVRLLLDCGANIYGLDFHRAGLRAESNGHEDVRSLLKAASEQRIAEYWARRNAG
ncbi:ankyrin repeat-containing domain protein [Cladorrhinum sp. PSN332]|nr:ankyrin repeat-containing domain protein [Cladorrhinum sp. PSN332]